MALSQGNHFGLLRQVFVLLIMAGVAAGVAAPWTKGRLDSAQSQADHLAVSPAEMLGIGADILWVDARGDSERSAQPGIPGAVTLNEDTWDMGPLLLAWSPARPVVVYCGGSGCQASRKVAERLAREAPDVKARYLSGGLPAWREANSAQGRGGR